MRYQKVILKSAIVLGLLAGASAPAMAAFNQRVIVDTGTGQEIPGGSLSFELPDGTTAPVEEDDDGSLVIVFPGDTAEPGTLIVAVPGQPQRRIAVPMVPGGSDLVIDLPGNRARAVPRGPSDMPGGPDTPRVMINLFGGYGEMFVPPVGAGTLIFGNGEEFAAQTDDRVSGPVGGGSASFPMFGGSGHLDFRYADGSDRASNSTPPGGDIDTGIVFTDFAPSGSTGLFLGNVGLDTAIEREVEHFSVGGGYRHPVGLDGQVGLGFTFQYASTQTDIFARVTSPTFGNDISADYDQSLDDDRITVFFNLDYDGSQTVERGVFFHAGGGLGLDFYDVSLESRQNVICNLCAGPDANFTLLVDDESDGTAFAARGFAGIGVKLGGNLAVSVNGFANHRDKIAQIVNPRTGDDLFVRNQPTAIGFDSGTSYGAFVLLTIGLE
ncbi:hypothetical protein [Qipengyuania sp. ASV99]|uniref:hypothetical protein n=1 Tax=Qipengyuania sp. ASV99 TaxID=3399681 RepID=UPI003A4C59F4